MTVRALIVEDEVNLVRLLRGYLEREGFEVREALDGIAALEAVRESKPDVVVLDWMLPKLDGMGVLRELRRFSDAYVIVLTARVEEVDRIVGLSTGADDYLTKPFSFAELLARLRALTRRGLAERPTVVEFRIRGGPPRKTRYWLVVEENEPAVQQYLLLVGALRFAARSAS